ncbi:MAG: type II toxin-antitoxin system HicA family toxin [Candidatus Amulumruptor caecigallinarius]|nr:type II toxin-antitoxin system HicA family toxin [Candidatus Amulumruptor caecigallinarius]MCM1395951.1 type II toxin-antitoxin system HicA family toxin [Candidatus Amulumruptor caecigallinarius]MCM1452986.1 type II toxin-antitoxin system HicA family toxin [bacterium]
MSTKDKLIERLLSQPKDFKYAEVVRIFKIFGFTEYSKGSTSGSRVQFYRNDNQSYIMHKPHPSTIIKEKALEQLVKYIREQKLIEEYQKERR